MKILVLAIHYPVCSGRYIVDALRRLGHDAHSAGPCTGNAIWGIEVNPKYTWIADPIPDGWQPELVIIADSGLPALKKTWDCPMVIYGVDNHVRDYAQFNGIADHFFLAHGHGHRIGEANVSWLPCGYDPAVFTPGPAWAERTTDFTMFGVMYNLRAELLYKLLTEMPDVKAQYGMGALYEKYASAYQDSKISVVRSAAGDVAQRVWETAAMGCLVAMDDCADSAALGLVHKENCLIYHSPDEALALIRWALDHPGDSEYIARAGQMWAQSGTWDNRVQVIIDWAETRNAPKAQKAVKK